MSALSQWNSVFFLSYIIIPIIIIHDSIFSNIIIHDSLFFNIIIHDSLFSSVIIHDSLISSIIIHDSLFSRHDHPSIIHYSSALFFMIHSSHDSLFSSLIIHDSLFSYTIIHDSLFLHIFQPPQVHHPQHACLTSHHWSIFPPCYLQVLSIHYQLSRMASCRECACLAIFHWCPGLTLGHWWLLFISLDKQKF